MTKNSDEINRDFYNHSGETFNKIPFEDILPGLFKKYGIGRELLEIGSAGGALAAWLVSEGFEVTCLEPAETLADVARKRGLCVYSETIQEFTTEQKYDGIIAISSLIHIPKVELPKQIEKISSLLQPQGFFLSSFIEGDHETFEDPTHKGKMRFFAKWSESVLDSLLSSHFTTLEKHKIHNEIMNRTFLLYVTIRK